MMDPKKGDSVVVDEVKCRILEISDEGVARCKPTYGTFDAQVKVDRLIWDNTAGLWRVK